MKKNFFHFFAVAGAIGVLGLTEQGETIKRPEPVEKVIELPGKLKLAYTEQGEETGVPVILLHGFSDSWHSYEMVLPHLSSGFHVFAISQRGHGNSSTNKKSYQSEDFANDIAAFIKQKKLGPAIIVGHSMGSTVAQCFATKFPSLTKALVLVASFSDFDKPMIHEFKKVINELKDPVDSVFIDEFQRSTVTKPINDKMLNLFISESRKLPASVWKGVAAGWKSADYREALRSFTKPVLILWGDKDAYCPRADQDELLKNLKNSKLVVYEGIGHALHWEAPEKFAVDITQFINSVTTSASNGEVPQWSPHSDRYSVPQVILNKDILAKENN